MRGGLTTNTLCGVFTKSESFNARGANMSKTTLIFTLTFTVVTVVLLYATIVSFNENLIVSIPLAISTLCAAYMTKITYEVM